MLIIPSYVKLNRFFRREMNKYFQNYPVPGYLSDDEMDDINNMFTGCAFE